MYIMKLIEGATCQYEVFKDGEYIGSVDEYGDGLWKLQGINGQRYSMYRTPNIADFEMLDC